MMIGTRRGHRRIPVVTNLATGCLALTIVSLVATSALGADDAQPWRALGATAQGYTFATGISARSATATEAIASLKAICADQRDGCHLVAVFAKGCRFVALGTKPTSTRGLAAVFVVGSSAADAQRRCEAMGLVCKREAQGGCVD